MQLEQLSTVHACNSCCRNRKRGITSCHCKEFIFLLPLWIREVMPDHVALLFPFYFYFLGWRRAEAISKGKKRYQDLSRGKEKVYGTETLCFEFGGLNLSIPFTRKMGDKDRIEILLVYYLLVNNLLFWANGPGVRVQWIGVPLACCAGGFQCPYWDSLIRSSHPPRWACACPKSYLAPVMPQGTLKTWFSLLSRCWQSGCGGILCSSIVWPIMMVLTRRQMDTDGLLMVLRVSYHFTWWFYQHLEWGNCQGICKLCVHVPSQPAEQNKPPGLLGSWQWWNEQDDVENPE